MMNLRRLTMIMVAHAKILKYWRINSQIAKKCSVKFVSSTNSFPFDHSAKVVECAYIILHIM
jgi:hypothetical protein